MTLKIEFISEASAEVGEADDFLEERRSGLGLDFIVAVHETIASTADWPNAGQPVATTPAGTVVRRVRVGRFPFYLGYMTVGDTLVVLAVAHERRRPNYWINRIP